MNWNERAVFQLKSGLNDGLSYSQIALRIGDGCTRSCVSGKVDRLGLGRGMTRSERSKSARPPMNRVPLLPVHVPEPLPEEPVSMNILLVNITHKACRWISGDPAINATMCGHPQKPNSPYCEFHAGRAYQPIKPYTPKDRDRI